MKILLPKGSSAECWEAGRGGGEGEAAPGRLRRFPRGSRLEAPVGWRRRRWGQGRTQK